MAAKRVERKQRGDEKRARCVFRAVASARRSARDNPALRLAPAAAGAGGPRAGSDRGVLPRAPCVLGAT